MTSESNIINTEDDDVARQLPPINLSSDSLNDYRQLISGIPVLEASEEVDIAKRIETGLYVGQLIAGNKLIARDDISLEEAVYLVEDGAAAMQLMINSNLRLAVSIAMRYRNSGMSIADITSEANFGLIHAIQMFDFTKGYKFSTYATWWIRQSITRAIADQSRTIRLPVHVTEKVNQIHRLESQMENDLGRAPSYDEIAQELEIIPDKVADLKKFERATSPVSLDVPLGDEFRSSLADIIVEDDSETQVTGILQDSIRKSIVDALSQLEAGSAEIVRRRIWILWS